MKANVGENGDPRHITSSRQNAVRYLRLPQYGMFKDGVSFNFFFGGIIVDNRLETFNCHRSAFHGPFETWFSSTKL